MARSSLNVLLRPWFVLTLLCFVYCMAVVAANDGDPLALVTIGTRFSEGIAEEDGGTEGYDGQFVYYIARDPSTAGTYISNGDDSPAYRFQRILLPALGMILSFGDDSLIPWALLLVNLLALAGGVAILEHLLVQNNYSRWLVIGYGLSLGVFGSVRLSLPEPLAFGLVLGGILLAQREKWLWSALIFALAALAKETTLVFVGGYCLYLLVQRRWQTLIPFTIIAALPFAVWQGILYDRLGEFGVGSGGALATSFEIIPFWGVVRILLEGNLAVFIIFMALLGPFVLLPTVWGLVYMWHELKLRRFDPTLFLLMFNAGVMLFVPFSTYREPLGILRFIVGLQIAVILMAAERRSQRTLTYSTLWFVTMIFLIGSDFSGEAP